MEPDVVIVIEVYRDKGKIYVATRDEENTSEEVAYWLYEAAQGLANQEPEKKLLLKVIDGGKR